MCLSTNFPRQSFNDQQLQLLLWLRGQRWSPHKLWYHQPPLCRPCGWRGEPRRNRNRKDRNHEGSQLDVADAAGDMLKMYLDLMKELLAHARENKSTLDVSGLDQTGNPGGPSTS